MLTEKEASLIRSLAQGDGVTSQRQLSKRIGVSIGLTNLLLKKLSGRGLICVTPVDKKRHRYSLSPKGRLAATRNSYSALVNTIRGYRILENWIETLLSKVYRQGYKTVRILGNGELRGIIESCLRSRPELYLLGETRGTSRTGGSAIVTFNLKQRCPEKQEEAIINLAEIFLTTSTTKLGKKQYENTD